MTLLVAVLLPADITANRPAAAGLPEGTLFPSTDDLIVYQVQSAAWVAWADYSGTGAGVSSIEKSGGSPITGAVTLSEGTGVTLTEVGQDIEIAASGGGGGIGSSELIYRYTVAGVDKASIDTGVDTPAAGSNDWTNGDLLEVFMYMRTDEATTISQGRLFFNNDSGANYAIDRMRALGSTQSNGVDPAGSGVLLGFPGTSISANQFGSAALEVPNYAGTVGKKAGLLRDGWPDPSNTQPVVGISEIGWTGTAAITRIKVAPDTGGKKLVVGSQLLIYKRLAS